MTQCTKSDFLNVGEGLGKKKFAYR